MSDQVIIERRYQGVTGQGQGGHAAGWVAEAIEGPAVADFFSPIPLERSLTIGVTGSRRELLDGGDLVLRVRPADAEIPVPDAATVEAAEAARRRSPVHVHAVVPDCYSCGTIPGSMGVHAGPLEGRAEFATPWTPPPWAAGPDGSVRPRHIWASIDCPSGWVAGTVGDEFRLAVTGTMTVVIHRPVPASTTHVIVAWSGPWKGRRVEAGSALFDATGTCLAASRSTWIALRS